MAIRRLKGKITLQIEDFHAHSFVPNEIIVSYAIDNGDTINLNLSVLHQFPGKLLMHIFVRQLANEPGGQWSNELIRFKNMDFCKTLESLRNLTIEQVQGESVLPQTFLISCPLKPGFYYVKDGRFQVSLLPIQIPNGRYLVQFELIQVYEEVIKLLSCRIKCKKFVPIDQKNSTNQTTKFTWSDEEEGKVTQITPTKSAKGEKPNETEISGEVDNEEEETEEDNEKEEEQEEDEEENQMQEDDKGQKQDDEEWKQEDDEEKDDEQKQEDYEEQEQQNNDKDEDY
ncbi:uncharacterized protein [Drosophila tropicalis]|uniref:uncharacterized protein n=1 Tax=Drosophila tropicalis TaxID=46794 RepID=UPI0035ABCD82